MSRKRPKSRRITTTPIPRPQASYDAVQDKKKRTAPRSVTKSEDKQLTVSERRKLVATARDQMRNFAVVAWMVRKHLDYVTRFTFQAKTEDRDFNKELEAWHANISRASRFDATGRFDMAAFDRLLETCAVVEGDAFEVSLRSGLVQGIEADRVFKPRDLPADWRTPPEGYEWTHGILLGPSKRPRYYCVCKRADSRLLFERMVPAWNVRQLGYFTRFDQWRGVSPLSASINAMQDLYEAFDYNLIKAKLHALFGLAVMKKEAEGAGGAPFSAPEESPAEGEESGSPTLSDQMASFKPGVAALLELGEGETVDLLESSSPSTEFTQYGDLTIHIALLALDIPKIFYDALQGSYSVHRTVAIQYEKSCVPKRQRLCTLKNARLAWRMGLAINAGELALPAGMAAEDVRWEYIAAGTPWIDPLKEVKADVEAVAGGLKSRTMICKERGYEFEDVVDDLASEQAYAESAGVTLGSWTADAEVDSKRIDDDE